MVGLVARREEGPHVTEDANLCPRPSTATSSQDPLLAAQFKYAPPLARAPGAGRLSLPHPSTLRPPPPPPRCGRGWGYAPALSGIDIHCSGQWGRISSRTLSVRGVWARRKGAPLLPNILPTHWSGGGGQDPETAGRAARAVVPWALRPATRLLHPPWWPPGDVRRRRVVTKAPAARRRQQRRRTALVGRGGVCARQTRPLPGPALGRRRRRSAAAKKRSAAVP